MTIMYAPPSPRRGLHRLAVDALGLRIVQGELPAGSVLPSEAELSLSLDMSRTVIREALKVLASKGLVESRPKTGTRVLPRAHWKLIDADVLGWQFDAGADPDFLRSITEVRSIIEPRAAGLAAVRRTEGEMARLEQLLARMGDTIENRPAYIAADLELHAEILQATHNELLTQMTGTLTVALQAAREVTTQIPGGMSAAMAIHRAVVEAIRDRDEALATCAMADLVDTAARDAEEILGRDSVRSVLAPRAAG